jgi:predicted lactoylglutathione lyase
MSASLGHGRRASAASPSGFNVGSREDVVAAHAAVSAVDGAQEISEPRDSEPGFSGFSFRDPERSIWDVVWAHGSVIDAAGHLDFAGKPPS